MNKTKVTSRHFRLEWNCSIIELLEFFAAVSKVTIKACYFRANIGEIYLSVRGLENQSNLYGEMLTDFEVVEDVLHEWRKKIRILATLSRKPNPENNWHGQWIDLKTITLETQAENSKKSF